MCMSKEFTANGGREILFVPFVVLIVEMTGRFNREGRDTDAGRASKYTAWQFDPEH